MKIELIVPAVEENAPIPNLAFPILATLSPPDVEISFTDDLLTPIDIRKDLKAVDLVGITVLTKTALRLMKSLMPIEKRGYRLSSAGSTPRPFLRRPKGMRILL
jgi:hypothetical protein